MLALKNRVQNGIHWASDHIAVPMARWAIKMPWAVLASGVAVLLITSGIVSGNHLRFVFFPVVEGDEVKIALEMPAGTPYEQTSSAMDDVIAAGFAAIGCKESAEYRSLSVTRGGQLASGFNTNGTSQRAEIAVATMELAPAEERTLTSAEIERRWRDAAGDVPGVRSLTFESAGFVGGGSDISLILAHNDEQQLAEAAVVLGKALEALDGVSDIESTAEPGKRQIEFDLTPAGSAAGLTVSDLARHLRNAFFGEEVQRFQRGREEVSVLVRYPQSERRSIEELARMQIPVPGGGEVPLVTVATVEESRADATIQRIDGLRTVSISADVDEAVTTPNAVQSLLQTTVLDELVATYPGLHCDELRNSRAGHLCALGEHSTLVSATTHHYCCDSFRVQRGGGRSSLAGLRSDFSFAVRCRCVIRRNHQRQYCAD